MAAPAPQQPQNINDLLGTPPGSGDASGQADSPKQAPPMRAIQGGKEGGGPRSNVAPVPIPTAPTTPPSPSASPRTNQTNPPGGLRGIQGGGEGGPPSRPGVDVGGVPNAPLANGAAAPVPPQQGQAPGSFDPQAVGQPLDRNGKVPTAGNSERESEQSGGGLTPEKETSAGGERTGSADSADPNGKKDLSGSNRGQDGKGSSGISGDTENQSRGGMAAARAGAKGGEAAAQAGKVAAQATARAAAAAGTAVATSPLTWIIVGALVAVLLITALLFVVILPGISASTSGNGGKAERASQQTEVSGDVSELAQQILKEKNITVQPNPLGSLQLAAKGECSKTIFGACSKLDPRMLKTILEMGQEFPLTVTSLTTGDHSTCSDHYAGRAVDLGVNLRAGDMVRIAKKNGAYQWGGAVPSPNITDSTNHIHIGWPGSKKVCEG